MNCQSDFTVITLKKMTQNTNKEKDTFAWENRSKE